LVQSTGGDPLWQEAEYPAFVYMPRWYLTCLHV